MQELRESLGMNYFLKISLILIYYYIYWVAQKNRNMTKQNVRRAVTAFLVIFFAIGIYFILPKKCFPMVIDGIEKVKIIVSLFLSSVLSTIIINVNPKSFFVLRESSEVIIIILITSVLLCAILWKCREFICIFSLKSFEKQWENNNNKRYIFIWNLEYGKKYKII